MTGTMTLVVAVGLTSAVCYAAMMRVGRRQGSYNTAASDAGGPSDDAGLTHWFGHSMTHGTGDPVDGSSSDADGDSACDGGGGGDGGGD